jgi:hypothetical protein
MPDAVKQRVRGYWARIVDANGKPVFQPASN